MSSASSSQATVPPVIAPLSLGKNLAVTFPANLLYSACQWGILVVLTKVGSKELVGLFVLALALTAPVFVCASLKLREIQATDLSGQFRFGDYLGLRLLSTVLALAVAFGVAWSVGHRQSVLVAVLLVAGAKGIESISDVVYGLLQQHERMDRVAHSRVAHGLATLTGVGVGALATGDVVGAAAGLLVARLLVLVACDVPLARWIVGPGGTTRLRPFFTWHQLRRLLLLGLPLAGTTLLTSLEINIPHYFVATSLGVAELGVFGAVVTLITAGGIFTRAVNMVTSPRLAALYQDRDFAGFRRLLFRILGGYLVLGVIGVAVVPFLGRWLLTFLYRAEYAEHTDLLLLVMCAAAVAYQAGALTTALIAIRVIHRQLPLRLTTATTSLVACVVLVPIFGMGGAALALVAAKLPFVMVSLVIVLRATRSRVTDVGVA
ncbi:MAG: polysaccharide biosynthesis protein [Planctomycetaceae bacterium]|nr:polysaccharide biosynthesis protein [Planctomycetaceae bacterium]|tara:strand:- start:1196 stop:2497 length:1302 start_codon:yes stop_codon:yes gene_type:complete